MKNDEPKRDITLQDIERADKAWRKHSHGYSGGFTYRDITLEDIDRAERAWRLKQVLHADEAYQREMEDRANQDSDVDGETEETK